MFRTGAELQPDALVWGTVHRTVRGTRRTGRSIFKSRLLVGLLLDCMNGSKIRGKNFHPTAQLARAHEVWFAHRTNVGTPRTPGLRWCARGRCASVSCVSSGATIARPCTASTGITASVSPNTMRAWSGRDGVGVLAPPSRPRAAPSRMPSQRPQHHCATHRCHRRSTLPRHRCRCD